jgi:hypothetical protein
MTRVSIHSQAYRQYVKGDVSFMARLPDAPRRVLRFLHSLRIS